ncbi:hypothetical protein GTY65_39635 [Streptomyces sp. SID8379]|uniref:hypothetical protein n=1 Tax=unclassified Streptomyces TaxID=2593676 RepID=UPI001319D3A4|nr:MULTISPECIES: hypothetical protein [unclassified Streptomyces]MYW70124.1 hypothetical protein [Streptomyces sp. SID8379]
MNPGTGGADPDAAEAIVVVHDSWQPCVPLSEGLRPMYAWIARQVAERGPASPADAVARPA